MRAVLFLLLTIGLTGDYTWSHGAVVRGDRSRPALALVFTGDEYGDGLSPITDVLERRGVPASFFLTGRFYRNPAVGPGIRRLVAAGHYVGAHSDQHLLYCAWENRDSLLVTRDQFRRDVLDNYAELERFGVERTRTPFFLPPYEWHNRQIARWTNELGLVLVNFTPGTRSNADYTTPDLPNYVSSDAILQGILRVAREEPDGLNGFLLLLHAGVHPDRPDPFHARLDTLVTSLQHMGYAFLRIDDLLDS